MPAPDYPGPQRRVFGIFVTPVPGSPFTANEHISTRERLPDGSDHVTVVVTHIARASSGVVYTERRRMVPAGYKGDSLLIEGQIYDPSSRMRTAFDPFTHIARQMILAHPPSTQPGPTGVGQVAGDASVVETDLGSTAMNGLEARGLRRERTVAADRSGTGKAVVVTDDYWYSPALTVYVALRHDDPRTGETLIALSDIDRHEPDGNRFRVPDAYKIVDETPPPPPPASENVPRP